ncbi:hypothetical protein GCM10029963_62270 [Micromonospora andamanensis]
MHRPQRTAAPRMIMKLLPRHAGRGDNNFMIGGSWGGGYWGEGWEAGWVSWVGDDPAITGELPEERPGDRLSRTGRGGPSQPDNERAVDPDRQAGWYRGPRDACHGVPVKGFVLADPRQ